ncbi:MAG: Sec-independent protein translocase protein TatB [Sphingobium sp.]
MLDIGSSELLMIVVIAVVVIGPKDLPRALYKVGQVIGKARAMSRHFRSGIDAMIREVEMEDLEKKWAEENRRIMQQHPSAPIADSGDTDKAAETPALAQGNAAGDVLAESAASADGNGAAVPALPGSQDPAPAGGKSA